jgi:non-heme chloroperoxidase
MHKLYTVLTAAALLICACSSPKAEKVVGHRALFIKGNSGNKLEVLDWGGTGASIIFLAGLGNTAHTFDDFAPGFTNKFHVYGLTRRGFGASDQAATGYSLNALAKDILAVTDSLHLGKVILIGHSIAGEEISKFAVLYPGRVSKVVYLDAAYDRTTREFIQMQAIPIQNPLPTAVDSSSFAHWKGFNKRIYGFAMPDDELKQNSVFSKEGKYLREVAPSSVIADIYNSMEPPAYAHITCPALALYANFKSVEEVIPYYAQLDAGNKGKANKFFELLQKYSNTEQARFKKQMRNGIIRFVEHPNHYIFISNPVETEKMIRDFLR